jgi:zinc transport system permease protein
MVRLAIMFGLACNAIGFALALVLNQPPGPILVLVSGLVTLSTFVVGRRA